VDHSVVCGYVHRGDDVACFIAHGRRESPAITTARDDHDAGSNLFRTGRLTKDPELKALPSGTSVCELRLAVDGMGRGREVGF
jgi:hypothetical protein